MPNFGKNYHVILEYILQCLSMELASQPNTVYHRHILSNSQETHLKPKPAANDTSWIKLPHARHVLVAGASHGRIRTHQDNLATGSELG